MELNKSVNLDVELATLRDELEGISTPDQLEQKLLERHYQMIGAQVTQARYKHKWLPLGVAAGITVLAIAVNFSGTQPKQIPAEPQANLVAARHLPIRVHSASRGAELRYIESRVVLDEYGRTRVVLIRTPKGY